MGAAAAHPHDGRRPGRRAGDGRGRRVALGAAGLAGGGGARRALSAALPGRSALRLRAAGTESGRLHRDPYRRRRLRHRCTGPPPSAPAARPGRRGGGGGGHRRRGRSTADRTRLCGPQPGAGGARSAGPGAGAQRGVHGRGGADAVGGRAGRRRRGPGHRARRGRGPRAAGRGPPRPPATAGGTGAARTGPGADRGGRRHRVAVPAGAGARPALSHRRAGPARRRRPRSAVSRYAGDA